MTQKKNYVFQNGCQKDFFFVFVFYSYRDIAHIDADAHTGLHTGSHVLNYVEPVDGWLTVCSFCSQDF